MSHALDFLAERGLDVELCEQLGIRPWANPTGPAVEARERKDDWIEIEYRHHGNVLRVKRRTLREPKVFVMTPGPRVSAWNRDILEDTTLADQPLVITEGELDAPVFIQCGWIRTISHPTGAPNGDEPHDSARYDWLEMERDQLRHVKRIILATDSDDAGQRLRDQLAMRLGRARCQWIPYPKACKDAGDTLRLYKAKGVEAAMARAQWMPVAGICRWSQLPPVPSPPAWDLPMLRPVWRPRPGDFTVITGIPGHGKSTFINWAIVRLARDHGLRTALTSFETGPADLQEIFRGLHAGIPGHEATVWQHRQADAWLEQHLVMMMPPDSGEANLPWLWDCAEAAVMREGCSLVVIDPYNQIDHLRRRDQTLTEYTGQTVKAFKLFAQQFRVHVVVLAHPKMPRDGDELQPPTLYSISDSAHWYNKADVGLCVWRDDRNITTLFNRKAKLEGVVGSFGAAVRLKWNVAKMQYETA